MKSNTCYFFGTFNPIHAGHLLMAQQALALLSESIGFETVTFVPAGNPPHRPANDKLLPSIQRYHLIEQAIYGQPNLRVSPVEVAMAKTGDVTYTANVLSSLGALPANQNRLPMLMGQDSFSTLPTWYQAELLFASCHFLVLQRTVPGALFTPLSDSLSSFNQEQQELLCSTPLQIQPIGISATQIRQRCQEFAGSSYQISQQLQGLMPSKALEYLVNNELYRHWLS